MWHIPAIESTLRTRFKPILLLRFDRLAVFNVDGIESAHFIPFCSLLVWFCDWFTSSLPLLVISFYIHTHITSNKERKIIITVQTFRYFFIPPRGLAFPRWAFFSGSLVFIHKIDIKHRIDFKWIRNKVKAKLNASIAYSIHCLWSE